MTAALLALALAAPPPAPGVKVPPGFAVRTFSDPALANDITSMSIDADGRVFVAGRGYVRALVDDDRDGRADRAIDLLDGLADAPMGLLADGDSLFVVTGGRLQRYRGYTGTTKLAGPPETLLALRTSNEHDAHAVRRGPDGWLYLLCGNMAGVRAELVTGPDSPVKNPVAGTLLRMSPDGERVEAVAHGFRNPYDFDFAPGGEAFTFDSDNERCVGLPWYEPCRFYHVVPGMHHGWLSPQLAQTWRRPPYFADAVPPVCTTGRGSPTGVACYRHTQFPAKFRGGFFLADWTFGKVWFVKPEKKNGAFTATPEPFLEAAGEDGFAPTALAVHPTTGELFVSIGGRGTRGSVFRIRYETGDANPTPIPLVKFAEPKRTAGDWRHPLALPELARLRGRQIELGDLTDPKAVGTVWEGYTFRKLVPADTAAALANELRPRFASAGREYRREIARTLAALGDSHADSVRLVAGALTPDSDPLDDIHFLVCLGRLGGPRTPEVTARVAVALLELDAKLDRAKHTRDRHWPLRVGEAVAALAAKDPALGKVILGHPTFGRPEHALYAAAPGADPVAAARRFVAVAAKNPEFGWTPGLVALLGALPAAESRPVLLTLWDRPGLQDAVLALLARGPLPADRAKFVAGLKSFDPNAVATAAGALAKHPAADNAETAALVRALRRLPDDKANAAARAAVTAVLRGRTGQTFAADAKAWADWFAAAHPADAAKLSAADGFDAAAWKNRLAGIDWAAGDADAGRKAFAKATCAGCHDGGRAVGPSLQGVGKRFGRDDLLTAILDPNRDVSPRYRPTQIATTDGKVHVGAVVYESPEAWILQTGPDVAVRVTGDRIESRRELDTSLMPAGLLDKLTDREVADLLAYLRVLGADPPPKSPGRP